MSAVGTDTGLTGPWHKGAVLVVFSLLGVLVGPLMVLVVVVVGA